MNAQREFEDSLDLIMYKLSLRRHVDDKERILTTAICETKMSIRFFENIINIGYISNPEYFLTRIDFAKQKIDIMETILSEL